MIMRLMWNFSNFMFSQILPWRTIILTKSQFNMKKQLFLLTFLSLSLQGFSQIKYEAGYFIDNNGTKTECLIKNIDWRVNPSQFEYKENETAKPKTATITSTQEFAVSNGKKYRRYIGDIDKSSHLLKHMSWSKEPEFVKDTLFLNVLVEGKATLYAYEENNLYRYFYNIDNNAPQQLVYKKYRIYGENAANDKIRENVQFRSQLWKDVKCTGFLTERVLKTNYKKASLVKYFVAYNECSEVPFKDLSKNQKRNTFNLTIKPGLRFSQLSVNNTNVNPVAYNTDFSWKFSFRGSIETEFILPYNKNKWSLFLEPTYQYYNATKDREPYNADITYSSVEVASGIRYYMYLNDNSKFYTNLSYAFDIHFNSFLEYEGNGRDWNLDTASNFSLGFGYKFKNRLSAELRYNFNRELFRDFTSFVGKYRSVDFTMGYTILKK